MRVQFLEIGLLSVKETKFYNTTNLGDHLLVHQKLVEYIIQLTMTEILFYSRM